MTTKQRLDVLLDEAKNARGVKWLTANFFLRIFRIVLVVVVKARNKAH